MERWRSIPGYEGFYEVSDCGSVRSVLRMYLTRGAGCRRAQGKMLRQFKSPRTKKCPGGYMKVTLCKEAKRTLFRVHSLVMLAFVGPRPNGTEVCHNDGNPSNNTLSNLRYDTPSGNWGDQRRHGRAQVGERHAKAKLTAQDVRDLRDGTYTTRQMADMRGVRISTAYQAKSGKHWREVA